VGGERHIRIVVDGEVFEFLDVGGIARVHAELLPRLCAAEPDLRIRLVTEGALARRPPRHDHITHVPLPDARRWLRPGRVWRGAVPRASTALRRAAFGSGRGAIWHSTHYTSPPSWGGRQVATVYDLIHERLPHQYARAHDDAYRVRKREAIEGADAIIAISRLTAGELVEVFGPAFGERTTVIPLAPAAAFRLVTDDAPPPPGRPYLLHVGRRMYHKSFPRLLDAYATWAGSTEVDLISVGPPWNEEEERQIHDLGVGDRVHRLAPLSDHDLAHRYRHAVALMHPSVTEGFGLPVLEALACDCPVVARRLSITEEIAGEFPLYVDMDDDESVHHALDAASARAGESDRTRGGAAHAAAFTWERTAEATVAVYRDLA